MYEGIYGLLFFLVRIFGGKKRREFLGRRREQDFSALTKDTKHWIHASSVGEVNLLSKFIEEALVAWDGKILLTVFTDTGYATAKKKYEGKERVQVYYFPLDRKKGIEAIAEATEIEALYLVETELWPQLIHIMSRRCRLCLINARLSERSLKSYQRFAFWTKPILDKISCFYLQSEEDRERFLSLGVKEEKCKVVGNLKFDIEVKDYSEEERKAFRDSYVAPEKKLWVAGSTRTGEYETLLSAFSKRREDTKLFLVPRHLERVPEICKSLEEKGYSYDLYEGGSKRKEAEILVVNAMGVLRKCYAIADYAFVGGSLVNIGGHSLLEPLAYGKTPIFGPYIQNVKEISRAVIEKNIGYSVQSSEDILAAMQDIEERGRSREKEIQDFLQANRRVGQRILESEEAWKTENKK